MSQVTASLVKELRDRTGLGMMECKRALAQSEGDIDKAIELLEKKSLTADSITSVAETVNANPFFSVKLSRYQLLKPYLKKIDIV